MKVDPNELRRRFLDFFVARFREHAGFAADDEKGLPRHTLIPNNNATGSSSLQPPDASTLFTSAGMHQFKDDFQGNLVHGTRAAATVQKCMRTPDLENVGKTARHHTFFEMLGFFSFGDGLKGPNGSKGFFKKEAIRWIWDFYTLPWDKGGCGLDTRKLYVSVYGGDEKGNDRDEEAAGYWREILGRIWPKDEVEKRIFWLGEHDNFWPAGAPSQGPNGVCGPCSEIFYDLGDEYGQGDVATNGARFMEIGNIVFTQYERSGPVPGKGTLTPLPAKNIDFGGGFERLVMVLDGAKTTLDSSLFFSTIDVLRRDIPDFESAGLLRSNSQSIFSKEFVLIANGWHGASAARRKGRPYLAHEDFIDLERQLQGDPIGFGAPSLNLLPLVSDDPGEWEQIFQDCHVREKRIADHIRAITFAMADGILPSNEGAGYVIRRIIRRAFRDGIALGFNGPFLHKLVPVIVDGYGEAYPELKRNTAAVAATIQQEEQQFSTTLERGLQLLAGLVREHKKRDDKTLDGKAAFDLYQSQGLPREVVQDELAAEGMLLDQLGYDAAEEAHRQASKGTKQTVVFEKGWFADLKSKAKPTEFLGYETCHAPAKVVAISRDGKSFDIIEQGDTAVVVLDRTPFYAESGGQVGDRGSLVVGESVFEVQDTKKRDDYWLHEGKVVHGKLRVGDSVTANVDETRRDAIRRNHSATHLMHAALRKVLGEHVVQRGSEVRPDGLRFDFSHPKAVTFEERQQIESLVNEQIRVNAPVGTAVMSPEEAQRAGAMALFGEKYGDRVRVLTMGGNGFSKELCGGTHVARTGDIGYFRIVSEGSSSAGVRRIEAVTGADAVAVAAEESRVLAQLHVLTKAQPGKVLEKVEGLLKEVKDLKGKAKSGGGVGAGVLETIRKDAEKVGDASLYVGDVGVAEAPDLLTIKESLGQDAKSFAILLGCRGEGRVSLLLAFSSDLVSRGLHAGKIVGEIARLVDGKGGGKPEVAQAGGKKPEALAEALAQGRNRLREMLKNQGA
ncbi:MAG: alanine--tRNA ligase [Planctomycetes bacterium]|nr:alanine--tRNA ligase [Planctomycetota bacterium]MCL4728857.1 alanine--tRNA ligase [Planctomycetota bacterium]